MAINTKYTQQNPSCDIHRKMLTITLKSRKEIINPGVIWRAFYSKISEKAEYPIPVQCFILDVSEMTYRKNSIRVGMDLACVAGA